MRKSSVTTPKLAFPFELSSTGRFAKVVEQDSDEEILNCVEVLLLTHVGTREEVPDYGIADYAFRQGGVDIAALRAAIHMWEPRAEIDILAGDIDGLVQRVRIHYQGRDNG